MFPELWKIFNSVIYRNSESSRLHGIQTLGEGSGFFAFEPNS